MQTNYLNTSRALLIGVLLSILPAWAAWADDTEIYMGAGSGSSDNWSNILMVVDTSGSMEGLIDYRNKDEGAPPIVYDPSVDYGSCFDDDHVYFTGAGLSTFIDSDGVGICYSTTDRHRFLATPGTPSSAAAEASAIVCKSLIDVLATKGYADGLFAAYDGSWERLFYQGDDWDIKRLVECKEDAGAHGKISGDSEVYTSTVSPTGWSTSDAKQVNWLSMEAANVYSGNFLNFVIEHYADLKLSTRINTVQEVLNQLIDEQSAVRMGVMRFDAGAKGGAVVYPVTPMDAAAKLTIKTAVRDKLSANGGTPLSETLYEAARYFRGMTLDYGLAANPPTSSLAKVGKSYISPIISECQANHLVLLTDGVPSVDEGVNPYPAGLPDWSFGHCKDDHGNNHGKCLDELAGYMATVDMGTGVSGTQSVSTHVVGFKTDQPLLQDTAKAGGGGYYTVNDRAELRDALANIVGDISDTASLFTVPAISINSFSGTVHRDEMYFSLFKPVKGPHWQGNLKKYKLIWSGGYPKLVGSDDVTPVIAPDTGLFIDAAQSYWSTGPDGNNVNQGGAASRLTESRKIYSYLGTLGRSWELTASGDLQTVAKTPDFDESRFKLPSGSVNPSRDQLVDWATGTDVKGEFPLSAPAVGGPRPQVADPLHSRPVVVQYGGTEDDPELYVFYGTNDGYLHAVREHDGAEMFSFIPEELLGNLQVYYRNTEVEALPRTYGMDGGISVWFQDKNNNHIVDGTDKVYLYAGMRRGGSSYYAMDITNLESPKLLWVASNDPDRDGTPSGDYAELGQSWSAPTVATVLWNGEYRKVLFVGGGYDPSQDFKYVDDNDNGVLDEGETTPAVAKDDKVGRAIYMIDAKTGERLWWAGKTGSGANLMSAHMTNSIPGDIFTTDMNGNGAIDRLYFTDMRAQVWRVDLDEDNTGAANFASGGGRLARLSTEGSAATNRHIYHKPSVAIVSRPGQIPYLAVLTGTGWRENPKSVATDDGIFMIRDPYVFGVPEDEASYMQVNLAIPGVGSLYDATPNKIGEADTAAERMIELSALSAANGWKVMVEADFFGDPTGEKIVNSPMIFAGLAIVPAYLPPDGSEVLPNCQINIGKTRLYMMNIADATPRFDFVEDGTLEAKDRISIDDSAGMTGVGAHIGEDGTSLVQGTTASSLDTRRLFPDYWYER